MKDVVFEIEHFPNAERPWLIKRIDGDYSQHAHMYTLKEAVMVKKLLIKGKLSKSKGIRYAQRRLCTDEEYRSLNRKPRYVNQQRRR